MTSYRDVSPEDERRFNEKNIAEFRANSGKVSGQFEGFPLALLTTVGAKTGEERVSPVALFEIDGAKYVVGSSGGRDKDPAWVSNLRKTPRVRVEIGGESIAEAIAVELARPERDRIFGVVKERAPGFAGYEAATARTIPVFELRLLTRPSS
ncbi:nitroreductase/quinone reductase family protein [Mycobacteriaceae bacterium NPDC060252]